MCTLFIKRSLVCAFTNIQKINLYKSFKKFLTIIKTSQVNDSGNRLSLTVESGSSSSSFNFTRLTITSKIIQN